MNSHENELILENICWDFSHQELVPFPSLIVHVINPGNDQTTQFSVKIDTGFNGALGIPIPVIETLNLHPAGSARIRTAGDEQFARYYHTIVSLPQTPYTDLRVVALQTPRPVLGRSILNLGTWLYDGTTEKWCWLK